MPEHLPNSPGQLAGGSGNLLQRDFEVLAGEVGPKFHQADAEVYEIHRCEAESHLHSQPQTHGRDCDCAPSDVVGK